MSILEHIERELLSHRQHAISAKATLDVDNDEIIHLDVVYPSHSENTQRSVRYIFQCGSDDDAYCFVAEHDQTDVIILPLPPE